LATRKINFLISVFLCKFYRFYKAIFQAELFWIYVRGLNGTVVDAGLVPANTEGAGLVPANNVINGILDRK
jgi:hypothetical protein